MMADMPNVRFKGFTDDWEQRKLGDYSELITKGTTPSSFRDDGNVTFVRIEALREKRVMKELCSAISEEIHKGELARSILKENDIVFAIAGTVGKCAIITKNILPANTNQALAIIRLKSNINRDFVYFSLTSKQMETYINQSKSVGAQPNLSLSQMNAFEFLCPCKKQEQQKIGDYFSTLDYLVTLHQRKCDETKELKKYMLQKMFPQNGKKIPEIRFAGFTDAWEQRKLGEMFIFKYGDGNNNPSNGGKYPVFGAGGIQGGYTKYNAENSVIIGHMGDAGCVSWGEGKHFVTYNGTITKPKDDIFPSKFGYYILLNMNLRKYRGGSGLPFLTYAMLTEMETMFPTDRKETEKIATIFTNLDNLIALHQCKCDELKEVKKFMLQNMFPQKG